MTWKEVETGIQEGWNASRLSWPECKYIRGWQEDDHDYFMVPIADTKGIIMQVCEKPCDCKVGVYIKTQEDVDATDWVLSSERK